MRKNIFPMNGKLVLIIFSFLLSFFILVPGVFAQTPFESVNTIKIIDSNINIYNIIFGTGDGSSPDTGYGYEVFVRAQGDFSTFDATDLILTVDGSQLTHDYFESFLVGEEYHLFAGGSFPGIPPFGEYEVQVQDALGQMSNEFFLGNLADYPKDAPDILYPAHFESISESQPTFSWSPFESEYLGINTPSRAYEVDLDAFGEFFYVYPIDPSQTSLTYVNPDWDPYQPSDLTPGTYTLTLHSNHNVAPRIHFEHHRIIEFSVNQPPIADANGPYLVAVGEQVNFDGSGSFDPDDDPLTETWTADGGIVVGNSYTAGNTAGIFDVQLIVKDGKEDSQPSQTFVVVFDPSGGFVTGGGWIWSPAGAYAADPSLEGKANFGFNSKYKKGANYPTGNTEFQFKVADLNFHSSSYEWLVVAGKKAMFKGTGTINGSGDYQFLLMAIDGDLVGGDGIDKFRIKIWDAVTGEGVYDNQYGASDDADPVTHLGGGSIVIHEPK